MSDKAKNRPKRVPLSLQHKNRLKSAGRPGFVQRWVNDDVGRIEQFKLAGWTLVERDADINHNYAGEASASGSMASRVVNKSPSASTRKAYLMEIPQEHYDEAQRIKQQELDELEVSFDPNKGNVMGADYGKFDINKK